jgi:hypothetical protein
VVGAIAIGSLTAASAADAASVTVNPSPSAITSTATTQMIWTIGSTVLDCTNASAVGNAASSATTRTISTNVNPRFTSCQYLSFFTYNFSCAGNGVLQATGATVGGVTPGTLSKISCTITNSLPGCSFVLEGSGAGNTGTVPVSYNNSTHQLTMLAAGQDLAINSVPGACFGYMAPGPVTLSAPGGANLVYNMVPSALTLTAT